MTDLQYTDVGYAMLPCRGELDSTIRRLWEYIYRNNPALPIFHHPDWMSIAAHTGLIPTWMNVIFQRGDHPIALLPIQQRTPWTAEVISPYVPDHPAWLMEPDTLDAVWAGLAHWFTRDSKLRLLNLGRYCDPRILTLFTQCADAHGLVLYAQQVSPSNVLLLPESWQVYEAGLGKSIRGNLRNTENRIQRDFPDLSVELLTARDPWEEALEILLEHSAQRWQHDPTNEFAKPTHLAFYREAMRWAIECGYAAIHVLRVQGKQIAGATVLHLPEQDIAHYHVVGRDTSPEYVRYRAGIVLLCRIIRWAIQQRLREIRMGQGQFAYKVNFGATEREQWELFLARSPRQIAYWRKIDAAIQQVRQLPATLRFHLQRQRISEA
ncbi:MAG: GNAT family N-acetyltransferase [Armatimonadota bacterium]